MPKDISGKVFGRLTALYPTKKRDAKGYLIWHCICKCGKEIDISYNSLRYGNVQSCGCQKKEKEQFLHDYLTHVDGTSMNLLKSTKLPQNNTTGVKGVYLIRGEYVAKIVFQKKQYILGSFDTLNEAAEARKKGEEIFHNTVVEYFDKWKAKEDADSLWAAENPMRILVDKDASRRIRVEFLPKI